MQDPRPSRETIRDLLQAHDRHVQRRSGYRRAAVLIGFFEQDGEWHLLLTRRTSYLPHHRGQIAFPGGSVDGGEHCIETALREAEEEIALHPSEVDVLGCHDDIWTPTGFVISPVVGVIRSIADLKPNPVEVSRIFSVPLAYFADDRNAEPQIIEDDGVKRKLYFYLYDKETIWGATALIIRNLLLFLGMLPGDEDELQLQA